MREIEFRGKSVISNKWVYGWLNATTEEDGERYWIDVDEDSYQVDPETIGQYTGLKDKNGKKIFEGDIVKVFCDCDGWLSQKRYLNGKVCYNQDFFDYEINYDHIRYGYDESLCNQSDNIEVIGNIYDNPELLEVEK